VAGISKSFLAKVVELLQLLSTRETILKVTYEDHFWINLNLCEQYKLYTYIFSTSSIIVQYPVIGDAWLVLSGNWQGIRM
jgi:hypothetical protein